MEHYDSFYTKSLKELKETPEKSDCILSNLKTILQYEYTLTKEVEFIEGPEDLSSLVQLLPYLKEHNTIHLLLRIIAERARNAKYSDDLSKQSLFWQLKLSRFVQPLYEFFSEVNFDDFLDGSMKENYQQDLQTNIKAFLLQKVETAAAQQRIFVELRDKLKTISETSTALSEDTIDELYNMFIQGIAPKKELTLDVYEVSSLLLLLVLINGISSSKNKDILNFLVTVENIRGTKTFFGLYSFKTALQIL